MYKIVVGLKHTRIYKRKKMPNSCDLGITIHLQINITSIMHYGKIANNQYKFRKKDVKDFFYSK